MPSKLNPDSRPRDKLLGLFQRLMLDGRRQYQADLAHWLECSPQTVARLVATIQDNIGADTQIEIGLDGRRRYYRMVPKSEARGLGFSYEEVRYLATCRDLAAQFLPEDVATRISKTLSSVALQLAEGPVRALSGQVMGFRNKGFIDYMPHVETIAALFKAIERKEICAVRYRAVGRGEAKDYRYAPGRIVAMSGTLYVQGCRLADGSVLPERSTVLSLHRIEHVAPTGEFFRFDAAEEETRCFGLNWHPPKRMQVEVEADAADYVRDRIWSDDQTIDNHPDGSLTLTLTTTSEKELNAWVLSFGGKARVISAGNFTIHTEAGER